MLCVTDSYFYFFTATMAVHLKPSISCRLLLFFAEKHKTAPKRIVFIVSLFMSPDKTIKFHFRHFSANVST